MNEPRQHNGSPHDRHISWQQIATGLISIVFLLTGIVFARAQDDIKQTQADIQKIQETFVTKESLEQQLEPIQKTLDDNRKSQERTENSIYQIMLYLKKSDGAHTQ